MCRNAPKLALLLLALGVLPAYSQGIKIHMHDASGYAADGMLYKPSATPPFAAVILIPDREGITGRIQEAAQRFATAGYFTVAIDPNRGMPSPAPLSDEDRLHDVESAMAFLAAQSNVQKGNVALAAWGGGGAYALRIAHESKVRALLLQDPKLTGSDQGVAEVPVLLSVAGDEASGSADSIEAIQRRLHATGPGSDAKIYPHAERGFDDPADQAHFRAGDADDLHRRQLQFLATYLGGHS